MKKMTILALLLACASAAWGQLCNWDAVEPTCGASDPASGTITVATVPESEPTCDKLQPPNDGNWDAYEKAVKACRGELMADYVVRAAKDLTGTLWCNDHGIWQTLLASCPPPPQDRINARAQEYLDEDKALLRRLLRLMALGVTQ